MPMQKSGGSWEPGASGWGLIDANNQRPIDPILLVSDERIEMTDWELHDFAVQIVRQDLRQKHELMSWQSNPQVTPTIWFVENGKPAWVLVKAVRYPETEASFPRIGNRSRNHASVPVNTVTSFRWLLPAPQRKSSVEAFL